MKKALVIRLGAFGDLVFMTPLLRLLKEDGYYVAVNVKKKQADAVLKNNPYIDEFIYHDLNIKLEDLDAHWHKIAKGFDKVINLTGSIEEYLLKKEGTPEFHWSLEKRHGFCNINYYDHTLEGSGYPVKGLNGELYFTPSEVQYARQIRNRFKDKFVVLWSLSGSSFHKTYPYTEKVINTLVKYHKDIVVITVGDEYCEFFEPGLRHEQIKNYVNKWTMRTSMLMSKFVDCVVGTDTGLLVAAGCFDVPKVILLSHTSRENLTKYWTNTRVIEADVECQPCHRLIYSLDACPIDPLWKSPVCMSQIPAQEVFNAVMDVYTEKKEKRHGKFYGSRIENVLR